MKKRVLLVVTGLVLISICVSCLNSSDVDPQISRLINENLKAFVDEDLDTYMGAIHPESPIYWSTKELMIEYFKEFDTRSKITKIEQLEKSNNEAIVKVEQITRIFQGDESLDNLTVATHMLRKYNGKWYIYESKFDRFENFN